MAALAFAVVQAIGQLTFIRPYVEDYSTLWFTASTLQLVAGAMILIYVCVYIGVYVSMLVCMCVYWCVCIWTGKTKCASCKGCINLLVILWFCDVHASCTTLAHTLC